MNACYPPLNPAKSPHLILNSPLKAVFKTSKNKPFFIKDVFDKCAGYTYCYCNKDKLAIGAKHLTNKVGQIVLFITLLVMKCYKC